MLAVGCDGGHAGGILRLVQPLVQLDNVTLAFGANQVLDDVTLSLSDGGCVGVQGPNGSGKTTLLRVMATLQPVTAGLVTVLPLEKNPRQEIGLVGHRAALNDLLTLRENLEFIAALRAIPSRDVERTLAATGLSPVASRRADRASQGMRRRTDLARASLMNPKLLLLDEPYNGLDDAAIGIVDRLITNTRDRGGAVVVVSHDPAVLARVTQRVISL